MKNEILEELWKAKDELGEEYGNDIDALAKALIEKEKNESNHIIDLSHNKKAAA
jgi:ATP-dependent Zn protease